MQVKDFQFHEYYHNFITMEVNELTDKFRDVISVDEDDCYAMGYGFLAFDGYLMFAILAIGPSYELCTKGLSHDSILGLLGMDDVFDCEGRIVQPDASMIQKGLDFQNGIDGNEESPLCEIRQREELDDIRDSFYPDVLLVTIKEDDQYYEEAMESLYMDGDYIVGKRIMAEEEYIYAMPYIDNDITYLLAIYIGEKPNEKESERMEKIVEIRKKEGFQFVQTSLRS